MIFRLVAAAAVLLALTTTSEARGFNCGRYLRGLYGLTGPQYRDLDLARNWAKRFPHTTAQPRAAVVQARRGRALGGGPGGHVARIEQLTKPCHAMVRDNRGRYERDICRNLLAYVMPR